ncbi:hypothetical protein GGS21DRAFT_496701 [Xylaria nigripes]|nr:hypothetical protein GGS21DRAFT_496701 [Xylaria nigripes]
MLFLFSCFLFYLRSMRGHEIKNKREEKKRFRCPRLFVDSHGAQDPNSNRFAILAKFSHIAQKKAHYSPLLCFWVTDDCRKLQIQRVASHGTC